MHTIALNPNPKQFGAHRLYQGSYGRKTAEIRGGSTAILTPPSAVKALAGIILATLFLTQSEQDFFQLVLQGVLFLKAKLFVAQLLWRRRYGTSK